MIVHVVNTYYITTGKVLFVVYEQYDFCNFISVINGDINRMGTLIEIFAPQNALCNVISQIIAGWKM